MARRAKTNKKYRKTPKKRFNPLGFLIKWLFILGLWAGIALTVVVAWYASELPDITKNATFEYSSSITIKAADGGVLARYGNIRGKNIDISDMPNHLIYAILSIEDRRFYEHFGLDLYGLARAIAVNIAAGRTVQGGSTITQQLAKNLFLSQNRNLKRKIQEALLALWLEDELTKDEILSAYLNRVYLGSGTYGVDAAARLYFNKGVQDLDLKESAMIAGLLKAPSRYSPHNNPDKAQKRASVVLNAMVDAGFLLEGEAQSAISAKRGTQASDIINASSRRYFTDWIMEALKDRIGTPDKNLIVETTLDPVIQTKAQEALSTIITKHGFAYDFEQGAALVMNHNGAILGMVGGADYAKSQFNRTTQALRQPGSAFKPLLYLTALEQGLTPDSQILDAPIESGQYRPKNFNQQYEGKVTLKTALAKSLNTVAIRLMQKTGPGAVIKTARSVGITSPLNRDLSLALGSSSLSMIELSTAYAAIASGYTAKPFGITKINDDEGNILYQRPKQPSTRVIKKSSSSTLSAMMEGVIEEGTGRAAKLPYSASGKTGTSQDSRDAWFVGFTDELVGAVWLGNDDNTPMAGVTGGGFPAKIWKEIMQASRGRVDLHKDKSTQSPLSTLLSTIKGAQTKRPGDNLNN